MIHLGHSRGDYVPVSAAWKHCQTLACENTLAVVWTDDQAAHLPRHLEPLVVEDEACSLWDVVEDELILALPSFSYHETEECNKYWPGLTLLRLPHRKTRR